jgi:hypothetical protein
MKFVMWDRRVATSAPLAVLCCVLLFAICTFKRRRLPPSLHPIKSIARAHRKQERRLANQTKTIAGRLQKGYEPDEFSVTGDEGKVWGLRSSAVKLDLHLGQKVTVSGLITHESKAGETKKGRTEGTPGTEESGNLSVASLKMVSKTCDK